MARKARTAFVETDVVLCRMRFTLAEIAALRSGDVLQAELESPPINVEICVNGTTLARGRLVIEDELRAVEITEIVAQPFVKSAPVKWSRRTAQ